MSVFETIKGALNTVPQGLSAGIKSLRSRSVSGTKDENPVVSGVDLDAGADLLNIYQDYWEDMHSKAEMNAEEAKKVDVVVSGIHQKLEHQNEQMNQLMSLLSMLPQLAKDLENITNSMKTLDDEFASLETRLTELDDLCEEVELHKNKLHHQYQLHSYRQRRHVELEAMKVHLAKQHASNAEGYERQLQEKIRERQQVFEEAFSAELLYYKQHGNTNLKPVLTGPSPDLAEVSIENDQRALDDFLGSIELTSTPERTELDDPEDDIPGNINGTVTIMQDEDSEEIPVENRLSSNKPSQNNEQNESTTSYTQQEKNKNPEIDSELEKQKEGDDETVANSEILSKIK